MSEQTDKGHENQNRPATAFLSYKRENVEEVKHLPLLLNVRGVRAWRDVTDIPLGGYSEDEVVHAIEAESTEAIIWELVLHQSLHKRRPSFRDCSKIERAETLHSLSVA